ncbi:MAG: virulence factor Mce family protein [Mycolicibacter algericus]|uniref:virulence factor Mce family protein n=1 Tax=Mycolicibacter algericus TaxID=1288388 RepID=UPI003C78FB90
MSRIRNPRVGVALVLVAILVAAGWLLNSATATGRTHVVAYFDNSSGIFVGDEIRILGVPVGAIDRIEPEPTRVKISFWFDNNHPVPADANAVILSPSLVTARAIQLTPAYTGGPRMADNAVIGQDHTAVPVEWDDLRRQLQHLTHMLEPTAPGEVSTLGAFINTTADNLRGQGPGIRRTITELSQAMSALGDHSGDIFSTVKNLSILVTALRDSETLMRQLNRNLASATATLANDPQEVANAVTDLNAAVRDVNGFIAENRDTMGTTSEKLASVSQTLIESLDDVKQLLHIAPGAVQNFVNIYQPAQGTLSGALSANNFSDPISFLCGAVQAASRLGAEQSAKLCVQYLAPIIKNRQFNFFPLGQNLFVGASARPNEVTYSEDWMRPDYVPRQEDPAANGNPEADRQVPDLPEMLMPHRSGS